MQCNNKLPTSCYWLELNVHKQPYTCSEESSERNQFSAFLCCLLSFVWKKLHQSVYLLWLPQTYSHHFTSERRRRHLPFVLLSPTVVTSPSHSCISIWLLTTTTPTHDKKWTMGLSDASVWFICKTKTFFMLLTGCPSWPPLVVNILYLYLLGPDSTPPGWPWSACTQLS